MQRISEPQMVEALTWMSASPWPGTGTGTSRISTVLLPGRKAASMVLGIMTFSPCPDLSGPILLSRRYLAVHVPQIFPGLILLPEEDMPFNQAAVAVDGGDGIHLRGGERITGDALLKTRSSVPLRRSTAC